ncbi:hypothetical protein M758_6G060800 [Ceratodon purpureus]|nr:hypothetical protein M758_6G060800 [Ceratodon purpureus]
MDFTTHLNLYSIDGTVVAYRYRSWPTSERRKEMDGEERPSGCVCFKSSNRMKLFQRVQGGHNGQEQIKRRSADRGENNCCSAPPSSLGFCDLEAFVIGI